MFCQHCGKELQDSDTYCDGCGSPVGAPQQVQPQFQARAYYPQQPAVNVPNHLVGAILVTIFCCLPFGVAAIVYASQVNSKLAAGDIAGAQQSSQKASSWITAALICGLVVQVLNIILTFGQLAAEF